MDGELAVSLARSPTIAIGGVWQRQIDPRWPPLTGDDSGGRWGRPGA